MKNLLAIRHVPFEDLGSLAPVLDAAGYRIQYVDAPTADFDRVAGYPWDLLVVLGGPISSNDTGHFPFLTREIQLIEARLKESLPVLGICLGSQLLARASGARVQRAEQTDLILSEVERLTRLFQNILEMARIDAGAVSSESRWTHPSEIIAAARDQVEHAGKLENRKSVRIHASPPLPAVNSLSPALRGRWC